MADAADFQSADQEQAATSIQMEEINTTARPPTTGEESRSFGATAKELSWEDIQYSVTVVDAETGTPYEKKILEGVTGSCKQGRLMAMMGVSGAGKTTLLNVIAGRKPNYSGFISVDGSDIDNKEKEVIAGYKSCVGFIQQEDLFFGASTVGEQIKFNTSVLGLDSTVADETLQKLNLTKCKENIIGAVSQHIPGGISGGEKKRLAIASELVRAPIFLLADEPTSGLDTVLAYDVVKIFKQLSQEQGVLALATIHQPSSSIYELFDDLCLLVPGGNVIYCGPREGALQHFENLGYPCPNFTNPADHWMTITTVYNNNPEDIARNKKFADAWKQKMEADANAKAASAEKKPRKSMVSRMQAKLQPVGKLKTVTILTKRLLKIVARDPMVTRMRAGQTIFIGVLVGLIFFRMDNDQKSVQSKTGCLFFIIINQVMSGLMGILNTFPAHRDVVRREVDAGMYTPGVYFLAKQFADFPFQVVYPTVFSTIVFWLVGFDNGHPEPVKAWLNLTFINLLSANAAIGLGFAVSAIARDMGMALAIGIPMILPQMIFAGLFVNTDTVPDALKWLEYAAFVKYVFSAAMGIVWEDVDIGCPQDQKIPIRNENGAVTGRLDICRYKTGQDVLELSLIHI